MPIFDFIASGITVALITVLPYASTVFVFRPWLILSERVWLAVPFYAAVCYIHYNYWCAMWIKPGSPPLKPPLDTEETLFLQAASGTSDIMVRC